MGILAYHFNFAFVSEYWPVLLKGLLITLELSLSAIVCATIIAIAFGILMSNKKRTIRYPVIALVDIIKSLPLLIMVLLCAYALPAFGIHVDPFWPAMIAISIDIAAFLGDVIRGSIEGIPKGSIMAATVLGMDRQTVLKRIILPEVFREILPSVTVFYIGVIRQSSLASVIAVYELTHTGDWIIASTYKPLEMYLVIALMYLIVILPLTMFSRRFEKSQRFKRRTI
ncbi:MAG: hypothetical protein JWO73_390 [Candidatus Taylorbacteria bacterium]|nr:hypothetical protein [Candidatus Taylorbacteria bacterium]